MAVTYSNLLRLAIQGVGDNPDTWGLVLNTGVFELIEDALAGMVTVDVTSGNATLTTVNGASDQARCMIIRTTTSDPGTARSILVPDGLTKVYLVHNRTTGGHAITIKTVSGSGVTAPADKPIWVYSNTTNVIGLTHAVTADSATDATTLAGVAATTYSRKDQTNIYTGANAITPFALTDAATITPNMNNGNKFRVTLNVAGATRVLGNPTNESGKDGMNWEVLVIQDGTGSRALTYGSQYRWPGGVTPTLTATANRADLLIFSYDATSNRHLGSIVQNYTL